MNEDDFSFGDKILLSVITVFGFFGFVICIFLIAGYTLSQPTTPCECITPCYPDYNSAYLEGYIRGEFDFMMLLTLQEICLKNPELDFCEQQPQQEYTYSWQCIKGISKGCLEYEPVRDCNTSFCIRACTKLDMDCEVEAWVREPSQAGGG